MIGRRHSSAWFGVLPPLGRPQIRNLDAHGKLRRRKRYPGERNVMSDFGGPAESHDSSAGDSDLEIFRTVPATRGSPLES